MQLQSVDIQRESGPQAQLVPSIREANLRARWQH